MARRPTPRKGLVDREVRLHPPRRCQPRTAPSPMGRRVTTQRRTNTRRRPHQSQNDLQAQRTIISRVDGRDVSPVKQAAVEHSLCLRQGPPRTRGPFNTRHVRRRGAHPLHEEGMHDQRCIDSLTREKASPPRVDSQSRASDRLDAAGLMAGTDHNRQQRRLGSPLTIELSSVFPNRLRPS